MRRRRRAVRALVRAAGGSAGPGLDPGDDRGRARPLRRGLALVFLTLVLFDPCASADEAEPASDNALATLCGIVETSAKSEGLPVNFFTRLIWRESAFQPGTVSPAGAMGVAQFMPGTASERGLANPFDPATA